MSNKYLKGQKFILLNNRGSSKGGDILTLDYYDNNMMVMEEMFSGQEPHYILNTAVGKIINLYEENYSIF